MELENAKLKAQEEVKLRDEQIIHLKDLLNRAIKERDEAEDKCQSLIFEKLFLQQNSAPISGISSIEDEPRRGIESNNGFSTSDCEESIVSSPILDQIPMEPEPELPILTNRALPEKGKLLQAVIKAGPLLQTLLLAGPLPQWRHPPPPLDTYQIPPPPVVVPSPPPHSLHQDSFLSVAAYNKKRVLAEDSFSPTQETKYQRLILQ